ncbi:hypothetical protein ScPMuIL_001872 [Solemya velum]
MSDQGSPGRGMDNSNICDSQLSPSGKEVRKLRKPTAATQARLRNGSPDCNSNPSMENAVKKTAVLSADAPVFIPKSYPAPQSVHQEALYEEFNRLLHVRPAHLEETSTAEENASVVKTFKTMLFQLTTQPGNVDEYIHSMGETLRKGVTNEETVKQIISLLYEQGVTEANFRYTGAKVCKYLTRMKDCPVFANFRNLFLRRCKDDFDKKNELVSNQSTLPRVCGLTMFIGELFLNMDLDDPNGGTLKIGVFRAALLDLMLTLLSHPSEATVKCVTQTIKLTGSTIQDTVYLQQNNDNTFDDVFDRLVILEKFPDIGKTGLLLIKSVLNLKECNWGRQDSSSSTPTSAPSDPAFPAEVSQFLQNEPVFYNTMGQMISREEAGFYQEDDYLNYSLNDEEEAAYTQWQNSWNQPYPQSPVYEPWSPHSSYTNSAGPDMDDEMDAAYEEFLRCQKSGYH